MGPDKHCCRGEKCNKYEKVEDKHLRCKSCGPNLDSCCCHDYPGHYMSVETEQCKKEIVACCEVKRHPPLPKSYCPDHRKLPFHFFQLQSRGCHKPSHRPHGKTLPPLAQNVHFPNNLKFTGRSHKPGCGCSRGY